MRSTWRGLVALLFVGMMLPGFAFGQVPPLINYQGILMNPSSGQPVADNTYSITFSIYNTASGGTAIWTETQSVTTRAGLYNVLLASSTALSATILSGPEKYLGIKVGSDSEMTPRKRIVSVAYAIACEEADKVDGKHATDFANVTHTHDDRYFSETELNTSDGNPPNQGSNRMSWDNLKDVPAGLLMELIMPVAAGLMMGSRSGWKPSPTKWASGRRVLIASWRWLEQYTRPLADLNSRMGPRRPRQRLVVQMPGTWPGIAAQYQEPTSWAPLTIMH